MWDAFQIPSHLALHPSYTALFVTLLKLAGFFSCPLRFATCCLPAYLCKKGQSLITHPCSLPQLLLPVVGGYQGCCPDQEEEVPAINTRLCSPGPFPRWETCTLQGATPGSGGSHLHIPPPLATGRASLHTADVLRGGFSPLCRKPLWHTTGMRVSAQVCRADAGIHTGLNPEHLQGLSWLRCLLLVTAAAILP